MPVHKITKAEVEGVLRYTPDTGDLVWKSSAYPFRCRVAGRITTGGYRQITIGGVAYAAHRLVWLLHTGRLPSADTDHINGNKLDNRIENLREATRSQNKMNGGARADNALGVRGVYAVGKGGAVRFRATLHSEGRRKHLGYFRSAEAASAAYHEAARAAYGAFAPPQGF